MSALIEEKRDTGNLTNYDLAQQQASQLHNTNETVLEATFVNIINKKINCGFILQG